MNTQNPPPPTDEYPDPFATSDPSFNGDSQSLDTGAPSVASSPGRVFLVLGIGLALVTYMIFNLFVFKDEPQAVPNERVMDITRGDETPALPDIGADIAPPPPPTFIPPEIPIGDPPMISADGDAPTNEFRQERLRSSMIISGGGGGGLLGDLGMGGDDAEEDMNLQFANRVYKSNTTAPKVTAKHIGNLHGVIAQGKIIHAVLETAINTDLPGSIRGIVSRDIYAEAGTSPLIPKGSRLIGQYNSSIMGGQKRVYVVWTRVIRPDGVDVMINSPLIDAIGQAGVAGQVDTKFTEIFSRALLTSVVTISLAAVVDEINGDQQQTTTTNSDGSTTSTGDATTSATVDSMDRFGSVAEAYLRRFINVQPTILVDQGTAVNVFVNRDLIFPARYGGAMIIE